MPQALPVLPLPSPFLVPHIRLCDAGRATEGILAPVFPFKKELSMDPFAHTFTGAALAASGLRRATPLATAALIIGANAPDIDILTLLGGDYASLAHRRGWTHGLPALVVLPFLITGLLLIWDRYVRRRRNAGAIPAAPWPLLGVAAIGVISHPVLDWLNNYGMRWLMPFDGRWFYGDALFIIDPWVWLVLGGVAFLVWSRHAVTLALWGLFWLCASWLVLTHEMVPGPARVIWAAGLGVLLLVRFLPRHREPGTEIVPRWALAVTALYMLVNVLANIPARAEVRQVLASGSEASVSRVMVSPVPANPFRGRVVAETGDGYRQGSWHWLKSPRFSPDPEPIPRLMDHPAARAAAGALPARRYLSWARFPIARVTREGTGYVVRFGDVRYLGISGLGWGPTIYLDADLRPLSK